jgi:hypothetical protein
MSLTLAVTLHKAFETEMQSLDTDIQKNVFLFSTPETEITEPVPSNYQNYKNILAVGNGLILPVSVQSCHNCFVTILEPVSYMAIENVRTLNTYEIGNFSHKSEFRMAQDNKHRFKQINQGCQPS